MADRDHHRLFLDQVLQIDTADLLAADLRPTILAELAANFAQIVLDDRQNILLVGQQFQVSR